MTLLHTGCKKSVLRHSLFVAFLFLHLPHLLNAQLCTGNLGDPVFNLTFGEGDFPPFSSDATDYAFVDGCPGPGEYTISSFLFGCGDGTWFLLTGDHARLSSKGCYMLVNGAGK